MGCFFTVPLARGQYVPPTRYTVDNWTTDDGLPVHSINDIEQTADGYLWLATTGGLVRFDGYRFQVLTQHNSPGLPGSRIASLFVSPTDTLWIGTEDGYVVSYANGRFTTHATDAQFERIYSITQDRNGRIWAIHPGGVLKYVQGRTLIPHQDAVKVREGVPFARQLARDRSGDLWITQDLASHLALARLRDGRVEVRTETLYPDVLTYPSRGDVLLTRRLGDHVAVLDLQANVLAAFAPGEGGRPLLVDRRGSLWVSSRGTITAYATGRPEPLARLTLWPDEPETLLVLEDREGNLWIGTQTHGLFRVKENPFVVYAGGQGIEGRSQVNTLMEGSQGAILALSGDRHLYRIGGDRAVKLADPVYGAFEDRRGYLWLHRMHPVAGSPSRMLFRARDGKEEPIAEINGDLTVIQIYQDSEEADVLWTFGNRGIYRIEASRMSEPAVTHLHPEIQKVRYLLKDTDGALWVATELGLHCIKDNERTTYTTADGLPVDHVRTVYQDRDGVLWLGTYGGGITRYKDGRFGTVTEQDGLAENIVSTILEDDAGNFWMSGNRGVHRVRRAALNAFLDGDADRVTGINYGREAGLINPEASGFPALKASDGRMWFPTFEGAAVVDPAEALALEAIPPRVHIERVLHDNAPVEMQDGVRLKAHQRRFEVVFTGISLRDPEGVRFRFKLDGFDPDWIEAGTARQATYTNVPGGAYTFRVRAMNAGGIWSTQDAVLPLTVQLYYYETPWFYLLCGLGVIGLAYAGYRYRVRRYKVQEQELNRIVAERTQALADEKEKVETMARQLQSLDKAKSGFFVNISHEFRTPLTLILGPLKAALSGAYGDIDPKLVSQLAIMQRSGHRLLRLINQLLDLAKLEAGSMTLHARRADVVPLVRGLAAAFASRAERQYITLTFQADPDVIECYYEAEKLETIVTNLLSNAVKFTPAHGKILVSVAQVGGEQGDTVEIAVSDTGRGIPAAHLPHIFDRFYQVDNSSTREHEGTGIGLALAKELVALHGGTISVESRLGFGTTFRVRFPQGQTHLTDAEPPGDGNPENPGGGETTGVGMLEPSLPDDDAGATHRTEGASADAPIVLVVEDNADMRAYLRSRLGAHYQVAEATDGIDGLRKAREAPPALVIADVMMPGMDGYALCRALKSDTHLNYVPVILLTARADQASRMEGLETGADAYFAKPFDADELLVQAENLIETRRALRERYRDEVVIQPSDIVVSSEEVRFLEKVRQVVEEHLGDDSFRVVALAEEVGVSPRTLRRMLDKLNLSPSGYIRMLRLQRAARLLEQGYGTVAEVAYAVGMSPDNLRRQFHQAYGVNPSEYPSKSD